MGYQGGFTPQGTPEAFATTLFPRRFAGFDSYVNEPALTVLQARCVAAADMEDVQDNYFGIVNMLGSPCTDCVNGGPIGMGPINANGVSDQSDYYTGQTGGMGPTILPSKTKGWWYMAGGVPAFPPFP